MARFIKISSGNGSEGAEGLINEDLIETVGITQAGPDSREKGEPEFWYYGVHMNSGQYHVIKWDSLDSCEADRKRFIKRLST